MNKPNVRFAERPATGGWRIGLAQLNAPASLNALGRPMVAALRCQLETWRDDPGIACVVLSGAGERAFCAGGDVVAVYRAIQAAGAAPPREAEAFFAEEYQLDYAIHTYPKPFLVWGDGLVMGGGMGLLAGGSHRVVTERSSLAMPEITIGLYPDVGASWFLNRMPGRVGLFLALTGARLNAADALDTGIADHFVAAARYGEILEALQKLLWCGQQAHDCGLVSGALRRLTARDRHQLAEPHVQTHRGVIDAVTDAPGVAEMLAALRAHTGQDPWLNSALSALERGSPTAAKLIVAQQRRTRHLSLKACFAAELELSAQCCRRHDFPEGVRALLIDKDHAPRWHPAALDGVDDALIAEHFYPAVANNPLAETSHGI